MKRRCLLVVAAILVSMTSICLTVFAQDAEATPEPITPPDEVTLQVELSPDGLYVAALTMDSQGETALYVWGTTDTTHQIRLVPDLTIFDGFSWSPNSQYIAARGRRGNATGAWFTLQVYDVLDKGYLPDAISARPGRDFREFVAGEDTGPRPNYIPGWSTDGHIIAINFLDGIHFYDITVCDNGECKLVYTLDTGYVSWFDWQGNTLITFEDKKIQVWDVSANLAAQVE